jgi:hypothetical protein
MFPAKPLLNQDSISEPPDFQEYTPSPPDLIIRRAVFSLVNSSRIRLGQMRIPAFPEKLTQGKRFHFSRFARGPKAVIPERAEYLRTALAFAR